MKILIIARGYFDKKQNLGIFEFDQAKALKDNGNEVIIAAIDIRSILHKRKFGRKIFSKDGIPVYGYSFPCGNMPTKIKRLVLRMVAKKLVLMVEKSEWKPDIIHAHFTDYAYAISAARPKDKNTHLVMTEHSSLLNQKNIKKNVLETAKLAYKEADALIAVSYSLANNIFLHTKYKALVVSNVLPKIEINDYNNIHKKSEDNFIFVSTGNLVEGKGMDLLIKSFYMSKNKNSKLWIFGSGMEEKKLKELTKSLGLSERVTFFGFVDRDYLFKKYCEANCFILASKSETFGVSYIEAMAVGLPVIATDCGGPSEFVNFDNGLIVPKDNLNELTKAINTIQDNINSYDIQLIRKYVEQNFGSDVIAQKLIKIYKSL